MYWASIGPMTPILVVSRGFSYGGNSGVIGATCWGGGGVGGDGVVNGYTGVYGSSCTHCSLFHSVLCIVVVG